MKFKKKRWYFSGEPNRLQYCQLISENGSLKAPRQSDPGSSGAHWILSNVEILLSESS